MGKNKKKKRTTISTWYKHPLSIITADFLLKSKCSRSNLTSSRAYMECKMLYSRPLSNNSMDRAPRSTPHQTCQPLSDQNMATFTDRNNPFLSQTIDHQQQTMQPLDSLVSELPLHSPSAEKARSATSEYRWTINPLFSQQASFDTDSSDTGYLEGYCSLLPFPPGQSSDKRDPEMNTLARQSPNTIDPPRSWPFASNRYSDQRPYTPTSDLGDNRSQMSDNDSTHPCGRLLEEVRVVHNQVEQRYRHRVRDNINALWKVIPESSTTSQARKARKGDAGRQGSDAGAFLDRTTWYERYRGVKYQVQRCVIWKEVDVSIKPGLGDLFFAFFLIFELAILGP